MFEKTRTNPLEVLWGQSQMQAQCLGWNVGSSTTLQNETCPFNWRMSSESTASACRKLRLNSWDCLFGIVSLKKFQFQSLARSVGKKNKLHSVWDSTFLYLRTTIGGKVNHSFFNWRGVSLQHLLLMFIVSLPSIDANKTFNLFAVRFINPTGDDRVLEIPM